MSPVSEILVDEHELRAPSKAIFVPGLDVDRPFRPSIDSITHYAANEDFVSLFNAITLSVFPTYRE
jgi:hypothetical protein